MERRYKVPDPDMKKSQKFGLLDSRRGKDEKDSLGLFPPQQTKGENGVTFTGEIVAGVIMVLSIDDRAQYGKASSHIGAWLMAIGLMLIGGFLARGGVIYWCKQLRGGKEEKYR